jgi:DNA-binding CsgD family transcriptional regulator
METDVFATALERIEAADSPQALRVAIASLLDLYGLSHAVYHLVRHPSVPEENPAVVFTYPGDWIQHYRAREYFRIDPVVLTASRSILPVDWDLLDLSAPRVKALFGEARDAGIGRQGLTLPIRGAAGELAMFTVTADVGEAEWRSRRSVLVRDMQILGHYVHIRYGALSGWAMQEPPALSKRERECLQWAADGLTIAATADRLCLSERVVRGYLDSARHKLGCMTKPHAIARGIARGVIHPR